MTNSVTTNINKILIKLDWDLEIYEIIDGTNPETPKKNYNLIYTLKREVSKALNLSQEFEAIWFWLDKKYELVEIYYMINDKASFSDSRVVYIWLKSWIMFNNHNNQGYKFFMSYNNSDQWILNPQQLTYLHEVRIGKK